MKMPLEDTLQVQSNIYERAGIEFLVDHLKHANLLNPARELTRSTSDQEFNSNKDFWKRILSEEIRALKWIKLKRFQVSDWYPRSPGVYYSAHSEAYRRHAEKYVREEDGVYFYKPHGKMLMIQGGIGTVRFKSIKIEGEDCWLYTATSDGYCHTGIPLAIPNRILESVGFDTKALFNITGQVRFLPDFLESHFLHYENVPQIYVFVDKMKKTLSIEKPIYITPVVFFTSKTSSYTGHKEGSVSYVRCKSDNRPAIEKAIRWLERYAHRYKGKIITNFDQQRPSFKEAPFSLQNIMTGRVNRVSLSSSGLRYNSGQLSEAIENAKAIQLIIQANKVNMRDINISGGDFRGAILNINSTLNNVQQNIENNPNMDLEDKKTLKQLINKLNKALKKVPNQRAEDAEAVAESAKSLVEIATKEKPNKKMLEIQGEGLKKAAQNIAQVLPDVLKIATQLLIFFKLPH